VLRKLAEAGLSHESVSKVRFAMGDMVKRMVAEEYLTSNIASGLKTPKAARRSDRSRLRRVTLREYLQAWTVLEERERLAFDLVTFCGMRESEAYGLRNGDLFQRGAIRVERSWYRGEINPTKTNEIREVGVGLEIFERLMAWVATLPDGSSAGWVFAAGQRPAPMRASTLGGVGTGLDQFCSVAALAFTLHEDRGTSPKIIADQQGHGLGVHLSEYVDSSIARKREAATALWLDFKALESGATGANRDNWVSP
jgi:integrase